ncbi:MAG: outer membrane lipoprotein-sorting protein [Gammaproteobacteria bacterium]|uniref:outer membrane lipoprotein-sorting protein n=1 Tax=Candidatus Njordibacter sp. Uisw_058 TaxID=3230974 RepID=UPI0030B67DFA
MMGFHINIALIGLSLFITNLAQAEMTARELVQKMNDNQLLTTDSSFNLLQLTSCKYGTHNGKLKCVEKPRIKLLESAQINLGADNKDSQSITIILEPANEKGIGMLTYTYDASDQDNETWLYLSALGKVKRIASGRDDEDTEPTSVFGSEISTEDQETGKLDHYTYKILQSGNYKGRPVAVIESLPTIEGAKHTRYGKLRTWVDRERFISLKIQMFDRHGNAIKHVSAAKVEQINGIWLARSVTFKNLVSQRLTNMNIKTINFGLNIDAKFLTQRALTDQGFRQRHLQSLREQVQ